jgi:predicted hotdog family 3-hydroxylacyl-ACP dehydratase
MPVVDTERRPRRPRGRPGGHALRDVERLVPHRPPALLLVAVLRAEGGGGVLLGCVPPEHPLVNAGRAPIVLAVELAAQAAAALAALVRTTGGDVSLGYLVGIRDAELRATQLPVGRRLVVELRAEGAAPPLAVHRAIVRRGPRILATATISTYAKVD